MKEVTDIFGNELKVGDKVAFGDTSSSYNAYLMAGEIYDIKEKTVNTEVYVKITNCGSNHNWYIGRTRKFIYPRNYYNNLVKIN